MTLAAPALPTTVKALRLARQASAQSGWNALVIGSISAKLMFLRKLKTGRLCLYLADVQAVVQVFDDRHAFQEWMADQAATTVGRERLVRLFVGDGVLAQSLRPRLRNYFKLLAQSRGDTAILGQSIEGTCSFVYVMR